jgi:hypothetical protein
MPFDGFGELTAGGFGELTAGGFGKLTAGKLRTPNFALRQAQDTFGPSASSGHSTRFLHKKRVEWRRRESNPRPKTFHSGVYILILNFEFRPLRLLQAGYVKD